MALTARQAAILTRQRLNLPPSEVPRLITYIDTALERLAKNVAMHPHRRAMLMTDRETVTSTVTNTLDRYYSSIATVQSSYGVLKEYLTYGTVFWNASTDTFTDADVTPASETITLTGHNFRTGNKVRLTTSDTLPAGLATNTDYYVIYVDANTIKLATSLNDAFDGTAINLSLLEGAGTHTITAWSRDVVQWVDAPEFPPITAGQNLSYIYGWLIDDKIYLSGVTGGTLSYTVPFLPTLTTLPTRLEDELITEMAQIAMSGGTDE